MIERKITITVNITIQVEDMNSGSITGFFYDGRYWSPEVEIKKLKKKKDGDIKINYYKKKAGTLNVVEKFIMDSGCTVFDTKLFFERFPKQKYQVRRIEKYVSELVTSKILYQKSSDEFYVNKQLLRTLRVNGEQKE